MKKDADRRKRELRELSKRQQEYRKKHPERIDVALTMDDSRRLQTILKATGQSKAGWVRTTIREQSAQQD